MIHVEMAEHVIPCPEEGQVEVIMQSLLALERWLHNVDMDPELVDCIVEYVQRWGQESMDKIVQEVPGWLNAMGQSQDKVGWRLFLEGMILKEITGIQRQYYTLNGSKMSLEKWSLGLITRLLEITHG
jgi:hypothetical protein